MSSRSIRTWLQEKWNSMVPGKAYILEGTYNTPAGSYIRTAGVACDFKLNSRAPNSTDEWVVQWRWLAPLKGVTLDHPWSTYTVVHVAADAEAGIGRIEVVYLRKSDSVEFHSKSMAIVLMQPRPDTSADA